MSQLDRSLIATLPLFRSAHPAELDRVLAGARPLRVTKGTAIFEQEAEAHSFFLLLDGHIRVVKTTPAGDQVIVRYISAGEMIGIAHALGRDTYPASAIAAVDCVALAWPSSLWPSFVAQIPGFAATTYQTVGSRLEDVQARLVEMATEQVEQRVARALHRLAEQSGRQTEAGRRIDFPISRQDIAEMTGTTLHTVSRLLAAREARGIIAGGRQQITVVEPARLLVLAEGRAPRG
ncbi:MAG: Crp/Fnr family transcriptional regulator [Candidatus Kaistia colombiensis]|nr:MAG: Crp/Fnr family transcriptional regulator [Kaistia sp.]